MQIEDIEMEDNEFALDNNDSSGLKTPKTPRSPGFLKNINAKTSKSSALINIFEPIQEEEAEYYEVLKYDEEDFKTAVKM